MTLLELARHRRHVRQEEESARTCAALHEAATELRTIAASQRSPQAVAAYLEEAAMFEAASGRAAGL